MYIKSRQYTHFLDRDKGEDADWFVPISLLHGNIADNWLCPLH